MGAEMGAVKEVSASERHRAGLTFTEPLAGSPGQPRYGVAVQTAAGDSLTVADPKITRLAVALMNMNATFGGAACHWGGPAAFAEIMAAIHGIMFRSDDWRRDFNFANDAGHTENGIYALKANYGFAGLDWDDLKGFRSIASKLTGHGESHLFADGVMVSNGPLGSSLPVAQGLAVADRIAGNQRTTICTISDGAMMEGEAKEALAAIPGLAKVDKLNPFVLVLSDNNTKLSGRIDTQAFGMQPSFSSLAELGWKVIEVTDGHDLQEVFSAIERATTAVSEQPSQPVFVWVRTIKGKGVKATEESSSGGHGFPAPKDAAGARAFVEEINGGPLADEPFASWLGEIEEEFAARAAKPKGDKPPSSKVQAGFPKAMIAAAKEGLPVVSVSADLQGSTGVAPFHSEFPQFSFDIGVAEANMVSTGSGLSRLGYIPVVDTFVQFGVTKGNLPLTMGQLSQGAVIACFTHCGFQDAADGASHQGLYYIAATAAIPGVVQYCPATAEEAEWAMGEAIRRFAEQRQADHGPETVLFFCGRENFPVSIKPDGSDYEWGKAMVVADTSADHERSVVISSAGYLTCYALEAVDALAEQGVGAVLLHNSTPNRPDVESHRAALERVGGRLITVEDHQAVGGAGSLLVTALATAGVACQPTILGVQGEFGQSAYEARELYDRHGIGPSAIVAAATGA